LVKISSEFGCRFTVKSGLRNVARVFRREQVLIQPHLGIDGMFAETQ